MMRKTIYELSDTEVREALMRFVENKIKAEWSSFAGVELHTQGDKKYQASVYMRWEDVE